MTEEKLSILHVEDDPDLAWIVRMAFEDFGFAGAMITAESVREASKILNEREHKQQTLSLIISDIQLPDGSGLDLVRTLKTNPYWRITPVIILSGGRDPGVINKAYALGANSFMTKDPLRGDLVASLKNFYKYWMENVQLPQNVSRDRIQEALDRATGLRARTSAFYLGLADVSVEESEIRFWLDRALVEGNMSNLLAFFRGKLSEQDFPHDLTDRLARSQERVADALIAAEKHLKKTPSPVPEMLYQWALELLEALDEQVFVEALACLFPKSPVAADALRARTAAQVKALALHIRDRTGKEELRRRAVSLLDWSQLLEEASR
jgi:CheY-like chemotaxis protein